MKKDLIRTNTTLSVGINNIEGKATHPHIVINFRNIWQTSEPLSRQYWELMYSTALNAQYISFQILPTGALMFVKFPQN